MVDGLRIRPFVRDDCRTRSDFACDEPSIDQFYQRHAWQNQQRGISATHVADLGDGTRILGFVTLTGGVIKAPELPTDTPGRRRLPGYDLPVLVLARLGVDRDAKGKGIGSHLTSFALRAALDAKAVSGCQGVVLDAIPSAVSFYANLGFVALTVASEEVNRSTTRMFMYIRTIEEACDLPGAAFG